MQSSQTQISNDNRQLIESTFTNMENYLYNNPEIVNGLRNSTISLVSEQAVPAQHFKDYIDRNSQSSSHNF